MGTEIERKFLLQSDGWKSSTPGQLIRQGYICDDPQRTVRVRIAAGQAYFTVKGPNAGAGRSEFEYYIPLSDAHYLLDNLCLKPLVEKTRHRVPFKGHVFEVDVFHGDNDGLVIAEVELKSNSEAVELPSWVGKEVTGDTRYYNSSLIKNPYSAW